jgi:hypothetical protein
MRRVIEVDDRFSVAPVSVLHGATRTVILVGRYAFKFPTMAYGWKSFLNGLLHNMNETAWWRSACNAGLCPIVFSIPGGFLNVMPRCEPVGGLTAERYNAFVNRGRCCDHPDDVHLPGGGCSLCEGASYMHDFDPGWIIPAENKEDSFGWLGGCGDESAGHLVAVDYA